MISTTAALLIGVVGINALNTGTGVGQFDSGTYMGVQTFVGDEASFCAINWVDSHTCGTKFVWDLSCDKAYTAQYDQTRKNVCGNSYFKLCDYTNAYTAGFIWNGAYGLTAVTTKKTEFSSNTTLDFSCKYGMYLSDNYRGDFSCSSLLSTYSKTLDTIPYDGCINGAGI